MSTYKIFPDIETANNVVLRDTYVNLNATDEDNTNIGSRINAESEDYYSAIVGLDVQPNQTRTTSVISPTKDNQNTTKGVHYYTYDTAHLINTLALNTLYKPYLNTRDTLNSTFYGATVKTTFYRVPESE